MNRYGLDSSRSVARAAGATEGFVKVVVDADSQRILGLSGDEGVHSLLATMAADRPYATLSRTVLIHPTVTERVPTRLQQSKPTS